MVILRSIIESIRPIDSLNTGKDQNEYFRIITHAVIGYSAELNKLVLSDFTVQGAHGIINSQLCSL